MRKQIFIFIFAILVLILVSTESISAYRRACLTYGESVPNSNNPMYTCRHDRCELCVTDNNYPTHPGYCSTLSACDFVGGNTTLDSEPPVLTINSPIDDQVYNTRSVSFILNSNEPSSISWIDNLNGRGVWKRIASNILNYNRPISLSEGFNDITIRASDKNGNIRDIARQFYVDSQLPKIKKTSPSNGFSDGNFNIVLVEKNLNNLIFSYGNSMTGIKSENIDPLSCDNDQGLYSCNVNVLLNDYNNQEISTKFIVTDIANNIVESKPVNVKVDSLPPVISNFENMYTKVGNNVYFNIAITDFNFKELSIKDNSVSKPKYTKLCSKLKNGTCEKKVKFSPGTHYIDVKLLDLAKNSNVYNIVITI
jgi:hypothetical protein